MRLRSFLGILVLVACQRAEETTTTTELPPTTTEAAAGTQPITLDGFQTPESVLYDPEQDVYFVSNINGPPVTADDNGFISRVNAESQQVEMMWIDGAKPDVTLNAPKGMTIVGDELWVSDLTSVRKFDRKTGAPKGAIAIKGSTFLNDLASDGTTAYVSDSGLKAGGASGFEPTGTDAIWQITGRTAKKYASGKDLNRPNGLAVVGGKVWVVTFGAKELYPIENGKKGQPVELPQGSLDGLVALPDGNLLVSSWDGKAVYRGKPGETFQAVVENVESPADLGFDTKRNRLLIPHFTENRVTIHSLP
jgi:hypothetical protein